MGVPSTFSSRTKTARPLASWPVTTVRTFIPCLFSSGLFMVTFLDSCTFVFIFNFPFVLLKLFSVNAYQKTALLGVGVAVGARVGKFLGIAHPDHVACADLRAVPLQHHPSSPSFRSATAGRIRRYHRIGPSLRGRRLSVGRSPVPDHDAGVGQPELRSERRQGRPALRGERRRSESNFS